MIQNLGKVESVPVNFDYNPKTSSCCELVTYIEKKTIKQIH